MKSDNDAFMRRVRRWFQADYEHCKEWRDQAREDYDFVAGEQWTEEEKRALQSKMRPVIAFNRIAPVINAVGGTEIANRQEVRFIPREAGDVQKNELLTSAAHWFRDESDADEEDSEAFLDTTICGMGWTETRLTFDENPDGDPLTNRCDPLFFLWDLNARKRNLVDRRRHWYIKQMPVEEAREMFPNLDATELDATWARDLWDGDDQDGEDQEEARQYRDDDSNANPAPDEDSKVTIVQIQWCEKEPFYRVPNPALTIPPEERENENEPEFLEMTPDEYTAYDDAEKAISGRSAGGLQQVRKVYYQRFLGRVPLGDKKKLRHWTFECITGYRDRNKGTFHGIVRGMKDPQRWSNKWLSQSMHILNSNAKGGVMYEEGAVEDEARFQASWAKADEATQVGRGALSQGKIQPKPTGQFPAGFYQLMTTAMEAVRDVSGVSLEMLGMREADQPGVLEYQRRQQGMVLLATLFASLRLYRKRQGRILLDHIINDLNDGRLIKIVGDEGAEYVPLAIQNTDVQYDIIVDDAPTSPNQREMVWSFFGPQLDQYPPEIQGELLKYSPLPAALAEKIAGMLAPEPTPEAEHMAQLDIAEREADVMKTQTEAQENLTQAYQAFMEAIQVAMMMGMPAPPELPQPYMRPTQGGMPPEPPQPPDMGGEMPQMEPPTEAAFSMPEPPVNGAGEPPIT